jgi:hypothetical protein
MKKNEAVSKLVFIQNVLEHLLIYLKFLGLHLYFSMKNIDVVLK